MICDKPEEGWIECNTNGSTKYNLAISSYGFCVKDSRGDLVYVESANTSVTTCMVVEATAG